MIATGLRPCHGSVAASRQAEPRRLRARPARSRGRPPSVSGRRRASRSRRRCSTCPRSCATRKAGRLLRPPASGRLASGAWPIRKHAAPNAAPRPTRRARCADGAVRRVGDAGPVRGRHLRARRGARGLRRVRRLAHGRARGRGAARSRVAPGRALERPRADRLRPGPVHPADERPRRDRRRPDRLPSSSRVVSC